MAAAKDKVKALTLLLVTVVLGACSNNGDTKKYNELATKSLKETKTNTESDYESKNYKWLSKVYDGPVFECGHNSCYFRIIGLENEEKIILHAEKIDIGEEGGSRDIKYHYQIDANILNEDNFVLNTLDSLKFIDSVTITGYFSKEKYKINLDERKALKISGSR